MKQDDITSELIEKVITYLSTHKFDGIKFFLTCFLDHGTVSPILTTPIGKGMGVIPHPVHFREGMQVRTFLRTCPECKDWSDHDFDNWWMYVIRLALATKLHQVTQDLLAGGE